VVEVLTDIKTPVRITKVYAVPISGKPLRWESSIIWTNECKGKGWLIYGQTDRFTDLNGVGEGSHMAGRKFRILKNYNILNTSSFSLDTNKIH
jgi:hypothetical protein